MNTNLRALIFASVTTAAVATALTITLGTAVAAESLHVTRLDAVQVVGHRDHFDADGNLKVTRLEQISVVAHRSAFIG